MAKLSRHGPANLVTQPTAAASADPEPQALDHSQAQRQLKDGLTHSSSSLPLTLRFCSDGIKQGAGKKGHSVSFLLG